MQLSWDDSDSESFQGSDWGSFWNSNWESDWRTGAASGVQSSCSWLQGLHTHSTGSAENMHKLRGNPAGRMKTEENKEKREGFNPTCSDQSIIFQDDSHANALHQLIIVVD